VLKNERSREVVYESPSPEQLPALMDELVNWIHVEDELDPLVHMAVMHHQFETIHPFYDGNGRTGRILNILFLVRAGLLDSPILYLSRYISQTKADYYTELQKVRDSGDCEGWLLYMLRGVAATARHTTALVEQIARLLQKTKT
jgi:Fic family protein